MVSMWYILKKSNNWNGSPMTSMPNSVLIYYLKRQHKVINTYSVRFNQSS